MISMDKDSETKVVQIFLTLDENLPAIYEVSVSATNRRLFCNCPGFNSRNQCKHIKFVKARIDTSQDTSHYLVRLDDSTPDDQLDKVLSMDMQSYREFIVKYGQIEVL